MKKVTILVIALFALLPVASLMASEDECITTILNVSEVETEDPIFVTDTPTGNRSGSAPILCTMRRDNIVISGTDLSEILTFEIYDESGFCLANFSNKEDFLAYIFTLNGNVEVKFHTERFVLSGSVTL